MKSLPVPVAKARREFADMVEDARRGQRIRLTRHGRPVAWLIGEGDHGRLDQAVPATRPEPRRKR